MPTSGNCLSFVSKQINELFVVLNYNFKIREYEYYGCSKLALLYKRV
jgi:hypothetical protein